ncbi:MAG: sulfite exporter TauE/SafE family protein [Acidobacteria bacterium]|nr:MAG: sulfite exporter TauE/SafE family protein [Acidobacteriota bacterium]
MLIEIPVIFFFIAFVFSMLGMGGSQVYIPILFWFGLDFKTAAIPLGMLLNVVNSGSATVTYARKKLIDWRIGLLFGITMLIAAPFGALANHLISTKVLILIFALFTTVAGVLMWIGWQPKQPLNTGRRTTLGLVGGGGLGFLAGLIGRGGGSFVVPLLYMAGISAKTAAATSALAVTFSGVSSFFSHLATAAKPNWPLWGGCVAAVFLGSQLGSHVMATKLKSRALKKIFAVVLLAIAAILIVKDIILA